MSDQYELWEPTKEEMENEAPPVTRAELDGAAAELNSLLHEGVGHVMVTHFHSEGDYVAKGHHVLVLDTGKDDGPLTYLSEPGLTGREALRLLKAMTAGALLNRVDE